MTAGSDLGVVLRRWRLTVDRDDVDGLLSELDEYAVEQALQIKEAADDGEITVLTVGPEDAGDALRKALSMGADKGVHVEDEDLHGTDAVGTSLVLAKAIEKAGYDLVVCGIASTDGAMECCRRCWRSAWASRRSPSSPSVSVEGGTVRGRRDGDTATEQLEASLPAVVSVTDQSGEARYPSFKGQPRRSRWSPWSPVCAARSSLNRPILPHRGAFPWLKSSSSSTTWTS
ncbi:electron transfer flavoprotein subunit beta/FixA family protein [Streptomyces sp. NPDC007983]|uniref:electron transfer flavoprotein subunit beta/FixA family protein n=1 Tax=Streptomyces sp. NPDC007983 TaxID=3364800 RepID=UPI0036EE85AC